MPLLAHEADPMSNTAPGSYHLPIRSDWLALRREVILDAARPIIDPHHHLWERPTWRYLLPELLEDTASGHNIVATVFMECHSMYRAAGPAALKPLGETEFVNGVAAMAASGGYGATRVCAGIIGHADLRLGAAVEDVLLAHIRAGGERFRGIRHITAWDEDRTLLNPKTEAVRGLMADARFREGFARLAPLGLSFDAWLFHPQLGELAELADAFPETPIILNHAGGPVRAGAYAQRLDDEFRHWSEAVRALARRANVVVKLGGLGMRINGFGFEAGAEPPSSETVAAAWKPYVHTCIEAFGAARSMFESNFPVDKGSVSYAVLWNAFKRLAADASESEKSALFHDTASSTYRLD
jgi:predicted TIM-barrel fold metal-dependent hydrolase